MVAGPPFACAPGVAPQIDQGPGSAPLSAVRADTSGVAPFLYIVEDDAELRRLLVRSLAEEGFEAEGIASGSHALQRQSERSADAYLLDIGLPDADGRDLCQALRARGVRAPILFLTARDAIPDR